ncbi:MAG: hypothetical protein CMF51_03135 [Legionellales bacterium]|nr:hypothetical protein [Legionellales bacterium]
MKFIQFRDPSEIQAGQEILFRQPCYGQTQNLLDQFKNNQAYTYYGQEWRWGSKKDRAHLSGVRHNADVSQRLIATLDYSQNNNLHSPTGPDFRRNMPQFLIPQYRARPAPPISTQTSTQSYVVHNRGAGTLPLSDQYNDQSTLYVVLNLANAFTPGGSAEVPDTGVAQEESLIRHSNALLHMPMGTYGDPGRRNPFDRQDLSSPLAEAGGTYRLDNLSFIDSTSKTHTSNCSMIFAAAPDLRNKVGGQAQKDSLCTHQGFNNFTAAVLNNIRMTLAHTKVLAKSNTDLNIELDLGALGCGVFQNPSLWVSALYRMALDEFFEENESLKAQINVSFSILGDDNLGETFRRMMNADINEVQSYLTYASDDWLNALDQLKGEGDYQPNRNHADQHRAQAQALELKEQTITPEMLRYRSTQNIKIDLKAPNTGVQQVQIVSTDSSPLNFKNIGLSILAFVCSALLFTTPTLDLTVLIGASILAVLGLGLSIFSVYKALKPFNPCTQFSDLNQIGGLCYQGTSCYLAFPDLHDEATLQAIFTPLGHQAYCNRFRKLVQPLLENNPRMTDTIKRALQAAGHPQHLYEPLLTSIQHSLDTPDDTTLIDINKQLHYGSTEYEQQLIASTKDLYNNPNRTPLEEEYLKQQQRYFQYSGLISVQIEDLIAIGFSNPQTLQLMGYSQKAILEAYSAHPELQENLPRSTQLHLQFKANTSFDDINQKYCNAGFFSSKPSNLIELFKEDCPPHQQINPMYHTIQDLSAVTHKSLNEIVSQFSQSSQDHPQLCEQQLLFLLKIQTPIHQLVNRPGFNAQAVKQALLKTERYGIQVEFQNHDFAVCLQMGLKSNDIKMIAKDSFSSALTAYLNSKEDPTNLNSERMKYCVNQGVCFKDISEALTGQNPNQLRDQYFTALSTMEPSQFKEIMLHSSDTEKTGQTQCINPTEHLKRALECYVQPKTLLILFENLQPAKSSAELADQLFELIPQVQWEGDDHPSKLEALKKVICFVLEHRPNPTGLFEQSQRAYNNDEIETSIDFKQWFESSCHTTKVIRLKQIKANQQAFEKNQQALHQNQQAFEKNQQALDQNQATLKQQVHSFDRPETSTQTTQLCSQQARLHRKAAQYFETQASLALRQESLALRQESLELHQGQLEKSINKANGFPFKSEGFTLTDFKEADYSADELGQKLSGFGYALEDLIEALRSDPTPYWFEVAVTAGISFDSLDFMAGNAEVTAAFIQHLSNSNFQHVKARYSEAIHQSLNVKQSIYNELINHGISLKVLIQMTNITYDELKEYTTPQFWIFTTRQFSDEDILTAITSIMTDESSVSAEFLEELSGRGFNHLPDMSIIPGFIDLEASTQAHNQTTAGADSLTGDMVLDDPSVFQADSAQSTDSLRPVTAQDVRPHPESMPPQDEGRVTQPGPDKDKIQSKSP